MKNNLHYSYWYAFWESWVRKIVLSYYQVELRIEGAVPSGEGGFYAPNHQNAIFDPILPALVTPHQLYFMTRSDVFKKPLLAKLFDAFKMIPIYRQRDGVDTRVMNAPIFDRCSHILHTGGVFSICPEGSFETARNLRQPIKKGLARMAFQALEEADFDQNIWVIPIGLYYESATKVGTKVLMWLGKEMNVKDYQQLYNMDKEKAIAAFTTDLGEAMKQLMIHIPNGSFYNTIERLRDYFEADLAQKWKLNPDSMYCRLIASQQIITNLRALEKKELENVKQDLTHYETLLEEQGVQHISAKNNDKQGGGGLWKYPLYSYGIWNNYLPWRVANHITKQKTTDEKFEPTVRVVVWILIFPLFYFLQSLLVLWLTASYLLMLLYLLTLPTIARFALCFHHKLEGMQKMKAYKKAIKDGGKEAEEIERLREKLWQRCIEPNNT